MYQPANMTSVIHDFIPVPGCSNVPLVTVAMDPEAVLVDVIEIEVVLDVAFNDDSVEPGACGVLEEALLCDRGIPDPVTLAVDEASFVEDAAAGPVLVGRTAEFEMAVEDGVDCPS